MVGKSQKYELVGNRTARKRFRQQRVSLEYLMQARSKGGAVNFEAENPFWFIGSGKYKRKRPPVQGRMIYCKSRFGLRLAQNLGSP